VAHLVALRDADQLTAEFDQVLESAYNGLGLLAVD
jgi:hypothetical protein